MDKYQLSLAIKFITENSQALDNVMKQVDQVEHHTSRLGGVFQTALGVAGGAAITAVGGGLLGLAGKVISAGASFNQLKEQSMIAFTTMLGSGEKAAAFLDDLQQFAASTPFEFPDLIRASQRLMAMGIEAKNVRPLMTAIGDAVAGLGGSAETIDRVTTAIGQMNAKGKASAEEMMQLTEAGIPAWDMLAKKLGVDIPTAMAMVTKGAVSANVAIQAVQEGMSARFGGMMEQQSHTAAGLLSTLQDTFGQISGQIMAPFFEMATAGMAKLAEATSSPAFAEGVKRFTDALAAGVKAAADFGAQAVPLIQKGIELIAGVVASAWPKVQAAFERVAAVLREDLPAAIGVVQAALARIPWDTIVAQVQAVADRLLPFIQELVSRRELIEGVALVIGTTLVVALGALTVSAGAAAVAMIAAAAPVIAITAAVAALAAGIVYLVRNWDDITERVPALGIALDALKTVAQEALSFITDEGQQVVTFFREDWPEISEAAQNVLTAVQVTVEGFVAAVKVLWDEFGDTILSVARLVWDQVKTVIDTNIKVILGIIKLVTDLLRGDWKAAWNDAKGIVETILTGIARLVEDQIKIVLTILGGVGKAALEALGNMAGVLVGAGEDLIKGFVAGVRSKFNDIVSAMTDLANLVPEPVRRVLKMFSPSEVFIEFGRNLMEGLRLGIEQTAPRVTDALKTVAESLPEAIKPQPGATGEVLGRTLVEAAVKAINPEGKPAVQAALSALTDGAAVASETATQVAEAGRKVGKHVRRGLLEELNPESKPAVVAAVGQLVEEAVGDAKPALARAGHAAGLFLSSGIVEELRPDARPRVAAAIGGLVEAAAADAKPRVGAAGGGVGDVLTDGVVGAIHDDAKPRVTAALNSVVQSVMDWYNGPGGDTIRQLLGSLATAPSTATAHADMGSTGTAAAAAAASAAAARAMGAAVFGGTGGGPSGTGPIVPSTSNVPGVSTGLAAALQAQGINVSGMLQGPMGGGESTTLQGHGGYMDSIIAAYLAQRAAELLFAPGFTPAGSVSLVQAAVTQALTSALVTPTPGGTVATGGKGGSALSLWEAVMQASPGGTITDVYQRHAEQQQTDKLTNAVAAGVVAGFEGMSVQMDGQTLGRFVQTTVRDTLTGGGFRGLPSTGG